MREFHVEWSIEVDADSPEEAARECRRIQQDPTSHAVTFTVRPMDDPDVDPIQVDLLELDEKEAAAKAQGE